MLDGSYIMMGGYLARKSWVRCHLYHPSPNTRILVQGRTGVVLAAPTLVLNVELCSTQLLSYFHLSQDAGYLVNASMLAWNRSAT